VTDDQVKRAYCVHPFVKIDIIQALKVLLRYLGIRPPEPLGEKGAQCCFSGFWVNIFYEDKAIRRIRRRWIQGKNGCGDLG